MSTPLDALPVGLRAVAPTLADTAITDWRAALIPPLRSAGIVTVKRIAMALGQWSIESARFTMLSEDLDYRAERIAQVWPTRYPTATEAAHLAHNPQALANAVYANRMGNGDAASGDGWLFRARGLTGTTGRDNYTRLAAALKMDLADLLPWMETPPGAVQSACFYWTEHALNGPADDWDIGSVTRAITGSSTGLAERIGACNAALAALTARLPAAAAAHEVTADELMARHNPTVTFDEPTPASNSDQTPTEEAVTEPLNAASLAASKGT